MQVQLIQARGRRFRQLTLELDEGACIADAMQASGWTPEGVAGFAIHGRTAQAETRLREGDRIELLGPLLMDPKDARRRRAEARGRMGR